MVRGDTQVHNFFGQGEDAGFAGDDQETAGGVATGPARPLQAARIDGAVEAVAGQRIDDELGDGFHLGS
jgi:hypothetical protein